MHTLKISTLSVLCVVCAGLTTNAIAAGSVRALGGAGTVNGTATASTSTRAVTPSRSGSLRITPSSARLVSTPAQNTSSDASSSSSSTSGQRLSIGKYLGGATTTPTSSSTSGGSSEPGSTTDVGPRVTALEQIVVDGDDNLVDRVATLEDIVPAVSGSDGVVLVNETTGEVTINPTRLLEVLEITDGTDGRTPEFQYANNKLQWRYTDETSDTAWRDLFDVTSLDSVYASDAQLISAINDEIVRTAATYASKDELAALSARVDELDTLAGGVSDKQPKSTADYQVGMTGGTWTALTAAQQGALNSGITDTDVAQITTNKNNISTLEGVVTTNAENVATTLGNLNTAVAGKADASDLSELATTVAGKADAATVTALQTTVAGKADADALVQSDWTEADDTKLSFIKNKPEIPAGVVVDTTLNAESGNAIANSAVTTALSGKADASDLTTLSETVAGKASAETVTALQTAVEGKADTTTVTALSETVAGKADATTVTALQTAVEGKASASDLATLTETVAGKADADALVQSDWTEADDTKLSFIKNKPEIPAGVVVDTTLSTTSTNAIANSAVTNALPNVANGALLNAPTPGAYVLGIVDGVPQYIAIVDGNGDTGVAINP